MTNESSPSSVLLPHLVPRFKTSWSHTSFPTHIFLTECLIMHRDSCTLYLQKHKTYQKEYVSFLRPVTMQTFFPQVFQFYNLPVVHTGTI